MGREPLLAMVPSADYRHLLHSYRRSTGTVIFATRDEHDLDMALKIADRAAEIGGEHFLSIEFAETSAALARTLKRISREEDAQRVLDRVVTSADYFLELGIDLPYHEVS